MFSLRAKLDAYAVTMDANPQWFIDHLKHLVDLSEAIPGRGFYGYTNQMKIIRGDVVHAEVYFSTGRTDIHVRLQGPLAQQLREHIDNFLYYNPVQWEPTRLDGALDFTEYGLFDRMAYKLTQHAEQKGLKISHQGDWTRGKERTLYIGSRKSEIMVRLYEKGQKEGTDPDWIRYETEHKPDKEPAREAAKHYSPNDLVMLRWSGEFLRTVGLNLETIPEPEPVVRPSDKERARIALMRQYRNTLITWAEEYPSREEFMQKLEEEIFNTESGSNQTEEVPF